jgi:hypothetical protein
MIDKLQKNELERLFSKQKMDDVLNLWRSLAKVDADHDPITCLTK